MLDTYEKHSKIKVTMMVVAILVVAGIVFVADHIKAQTTTSVASQSAASTPTAAATTPPSSTTSTSDSTTSTTTTTPATTTSSYKDGTYTATSDYEVPHGDEEIEVSLTLSGGTITDVSIQNSEGDRDSAQYQEDFAAAYKSYVIGKKISGLQLSRISGASDTTQGFNDALSQIAAKAQA